LGVPLRYLVAPGHEDDDEESVVGRRAGYLIVERDDKASPLDREG
jgi:hypothetical protein